MLSLNKGKLNYTKLIKLLYLADKEMLKKSEETITGDIYVNMDNGPVLSEIYNLIMEKGNPHFQCKWDIYFQTNNYDLEMTNENISTNELSDMEISILNKIDKKFKQHNFQDMINYTHNKKHCPEWENPNGSSVPLPIEKILKSLNIPDKEIKHIIDERKIYKKEKEILVNNCS